MQIKLFDYKLPDGRIAQKPVSPRDHSRLLFLNKKNGQISHCHFYDLPEILQPGDVLVLNETKVFPARLIGRKNSGGKVELFLLKPLKNGLWQCLIGGRRLRAGQTILFAKGLKAELVSGVNTKIKIVKFNYKNSKLNTLIAQLGHTPLPPYIKTPDSQKIRKSYQTVFAKTSGSVAAPTAGLHFTPQLLKKLKSQGVKIFKITLHVGWGTFAPVSVSDITKHQIHREWVSISPAAARALNLLKKQGRRIIAVGTTTTRALEAMTRNKKLISGEQDVDIYIYPGYKFKFINSLITNFHLPQSSLLFLVCALAGQKNILRAYNIAVRRKYRFYSFGDAMFIN
ncbi:MAG: tRNA preQ1(34) S-adenosylmethionine ribosyltransferase-isomerase QueA [Parcubacteria group bacterium]|nr:MAG: tRNA preQ1(34) S-adenosylmethionine ribosyltransferase-isomerase QueA [Parcubacteria group bacterium]